jgi:acetyltransferase-like isoleucine patch superfamily enzyme
MNNNKDCFGEVMEKEKNHIISKKYRTIDIVKSGSRAGKYANLIVGKKGFFALLKYELLTGIFTNWPGALGIFLRSVFYRFLFKKIGKNVNIGRNVTFRNPNRISIGSNVIIDENCMLDAKGDENEGIVISDNCFIGRNSILSCKNGNITLKKHVTVGFNCELFSASELLIGSDTLIAAYVYCIAGDHEYYTAEKAVVDLEAISRGITIGDNCWLGAKALIFDGVNVGESTIIGAASVVSKDIPPFSIALGSPARVVKQRD